MQRQVRALRSDELLAGELLELLDVLDDRRRVAPRPWINDLDAPLALHARYRREEVLAALGIVRNGQIPLTAGRCRFRG